MNDKTNNTQEGGEHRNAIGRRRRIYVRVTENELTRIRSRACKAGMSISALHPHEDAGRSRGTANGGPRHR